MDHIKGLASPTSRDDGPGLAHGGVTKECNAVWTERNVLKFETGDGCAISMYPWVLPLNGGHGGVVYSLMEGADGGS